MLIVICLISLLISLPGFINKAGYGFFKGLIPGYNLYLFLSIIEFPPVLLILFALGLIFLPNRVFVITLMCSLLPFMVSDAFGKKKLTGILTLFLPFVMYPYLAYVGGIYGYDVAEERYGFIKKNNVLCLILVVFSIYVYTNYTKIVDGNNLVDKDNMHYVNDIYMSEGRIYNNYLSDKEKKMYKYMFDNASAFKNELEIDFNYFGCRDYNECGVIINKAHDAILVDHPELINYAGYSWSYNQDVFKLKLEFSVNSLVTSRLGEMKIERIINDIKEDTKKMSDLEKVRYVYEWIGENNTYDRTFTYFSKNQSIYNVFMKHNAVCAGFAKASSVIFQNIGIEAYAITGESTGPHMWNIVKIDDKYYYFDSTVAASANNKEVDWYYDGLKHDYMSFYTVDYPEWYPEIEKTNGLYFQ